MTRLLLLGFSVLAFLLLSEPAYGDAGTSGVVTGVAPDSFVLRDPNGRVLVMYPDKAVLAGSSPRLPWNAKNHGGLPSPQVPFSAITPGMIVDVQFHYYKRHKGKIICTLLIPRQSAPPENIAQLKEKVQRLEKENARLKEENKKLRAQLGKDI
jgi:hypothetical protein